MVVLDVAKLQHVGPGPWPSQCLAPLGDQDRRCCCEPGLEHEPTRRLVTTHHCTIHTVSVYRLPQSWEFVIHPVQVSCPKVALQISRRSL